MPPADDRPGTTGDAQWDASSRPPRPRGPAGADPDRTTPPVGVGIPPAATEDIPGWLLTDGDDGPRPAGRRRVLVAMSVLPWIVAIALFLRSPVTAPAGTAPEPTSGAAPSPSPTPTGPAASLSSPPPAPPPAPAATEPQTGERVAVGGGARTSLTLADATSLAVMVARDWLGGVGPRVGWFEDPVHPDGYVAEVSVEAVDHPAPGHVVVTVLAQILRSEGDDYRDALLRRVAVPIAVDASGANPAGTPWLLAPPDAELRLPETDELDDPALVPEVVGALEGAGYRQIDVTAIEQTAGWPLLATVEAVAPGDDASAPYVIWFRHHGNALVVAGDMPTQEGTP